MKCLPWSMQGLAMHELAVCQALISQVEALAREHEAAIVLSIRVQVGPLSGVEMALLKRAYPLAAVGTVAEHAALDLESMPVKVRCKTCLAETEASPNRLLCGVCGDYHTELISGDEMLLTSVEFDTSLH